jgi:8-oxo-dGTP diphosphatase
VPDGFPLQGVPVHGSGAGRQALARADPIVTAPDRRVIVVVAAIVEEDGRFLVTRRLRGTHLAGLWEFPGGKCEPGETHQACLVREMAEELGVQAIVGGELLRTEHTYATRTVRLHFRRCHIAGRPRALLNQEMRWVTREQLRSLEFPPADAELIRLLVEGPPFAPAQGLD